MVSNFLGKIIKVMLTPIFVITNISRYKLESVCYGWLTVFSATSNNMSARSWQSVLLVEETGVPGGKPPTCRKPLTNDVA